MEAGGTRTDRLIQAALGGLALRQRVVADNVANASTPGFKASEVHFEDALRQAMRPSGSMELSGVPNGLQPITTANATPEVSVMNNAGIHSSGNSVDIDEQMLTLAESNLTYNALAQIMSERMRSIRTVISGGRR